MEYNIIESRIFEILSRVNSTINIFEKEINPSVFDIENKNQLISIRKDIRNFLLIIFDVL